MRKVRCVSPHGGCHNGMRADNGMAAHPGYGGALRLPPNEGGHVFNAVLGYVPVGAVVDAPEAPAFIADGFHFVDADGKADECAGADGCWCGGAHHGQPEPGNPEDEDREGDRPLTLSPAAAAWPSASAVVPDTTGGM